MAFPFRPDGGGGQPRAVIFTNEGQLESLEEMSSIGLGEDIYDDQTLLTTEDAAGSIHTIDMPFEHVLEESVKMLHEVDGFQCPLELFGKVTPVEFGELVHLFQTIDSDNDGQITKLDALRLLHILGHSNDENKSYIKGDESIVQQRANQEAKELLNLLDVDGNGTADFEEFCRFVVKLKAGDKRVRKFQDLLERLNSTPLGELERQAIMRGLTLNFQVVEIQPATMSKPTTYVVEASLTGDWMVTNKNDSQLYEFRRVHETRTYQGIAPNTRDAKFAAAQNALISMGEMMPGVKVRPGEIPDEWLRWTNENLARGVSPGRIVEILSSKGFHPHKNLSLLYRIISWNELTRYAHRTGRLDLLPTEVLQNGEERVMPPIGVDFLDWVRDTVNLGIDGEVMWVMLRDSGIDLDKVDLGFSQKLRFNELNRLLVDRYGGRRGKLDLWEASREGYLECVRIFCQCGQDVREEHLDRYTSERICALSYAARNGHADVIKLLLDYNADVNQLDAKGRTPLHWAAINGHEDAAKVLIDHGGAMFAPDIQGNLPIHHAAEMAHENVVDLLASRGQESARLITSDKVRARTEFTFDQMVEQIFIELPSKKLCPAEMLRFEKTWLHEAAIEFRNRTQENVRFMVPRSCEAIMEDVLARFDPRPETAVTIHNEVTGEEHMIRVISTAADLAGLLRYVFRQAAVDGINRWKRTALAIACDANKISSHEKIIFLLLNNYGANAHLKDHHGKLPIDLLMQDKVIRDMPSATQVREEFLTTNREELLQKMFREFNDMDAKRQAIIHEQILKECRDADANQELRVWHAVRKASILKCFFGPNHRPPRPGGYKSASATTSFHLSKSNNLLNFNVQEDDDEDDDVVLGEKRLRVWEMYEDPDTGRNFFTKLPKHPNFGEKHNLYSWHIPPDIKAMVDWRTALLYLRVEGSELLRSCEEWNVYRCNRTEIEYYFNTQTEELLFTPPQKLSWKYILRHSKPTGERLGYASEWIVYLDPYNNEFFRNIITKYCDYNRPVDAKEILPIEKLCTAFQYKQKPIMQKWFSCEQCNRAWKTALAERSMLKEGSLEGTSEEEKGTTLIYDDEGNVIGSGNDESNVNTRSLIVCEPCIARCHVGHKGVRFVFEIESSRTTACMCQDVSRLTAQMCNACVISHLQLETQAAAADQRIEWKRVRHRNRHFPPMFAYVPSVNRNSEWKTLSGWMICRQCTPNREVVRKKLERYLNADFAADLDSDEESEFSFLDDGIVNTKSSISSTLGDDSDGSDGSDDSGAITFSEGEDDEVTALIAQEAEKHTKALLARQESRRQTLLNGVEEEPGLNSLSLASSLAKFSNRPEIEFEWVQLFDVEEKEILKPGASVLCARPSSLRRVLGRVKSQPRPGFYLVRFNKSENLDVEEEVFPRFSLELLSRPCFYFNTLTGSSVWHRSQVHNPMHSTSLSLGAMDWWRLMSRSTIKRVFNEWDEMYSPQMNTIFYVHHDSYVTEKASLRLQTLWRMSKFVARPFLPWRSEAFTFDVPSVVAEAKAELASWAYLRRRGFQIGTVLDISGDEWVEYMDQDTAAVFYWEEELNRYQWSKPLLYTSKFNPKNKERSTTYRVGDDVLFRFPGRRQEEVAVVVRIRFEDGTDEDHYDIANKYNSSLVVRWVPKMRIRAVPMEGDEVKLAKMEVVWRNQIKRRREADERREAREKARKIEQEMRELEQLQAAEFRYHQPTDGDVDPKAAFSSDKPLVVSQAARLMKGRLERIAIERLVIKQKIDSEEGEARRQAIQAEIVQIREKVGKISRAAMLSLTRSLDMKHILMARIEKRNALHIELNMKKEETVQRIKQVYDASLCKEISATTPRSLKRRNLIRHTHISMVRQTEGFIICEWGCGDWFRIGHEQTDHHLRRCVKRIIGCTLGCPLKNTEEDWLRIHVPKGDKETIVGSHSSVSSYDSKVPQLEEKSEANIEGIPGLLSLKDIEVTEQENIGNVTEQQFHEMYECPKRLVMCPLQCLEWVCAEVLGHHVKELCIKRPAEPLFCRLGCGKSYGGSLEALIEAEDERTEHENEECEFRIITCNWCHNGRICAAQLRAKDSGEHRAFHLSNIGIMLYSTPGTYSFAIPKDLTRIKIQLWGAGGGSGTFRGRAYGKGGGGAFVEAILEVEPQTILELVVGSGGSAGIFGRDYEASNIDLLRKRAAKRKLVEKTLPRNTRLSMELLDATLGEDPELLENDARRKITSCGVANGGFPGGGIGYSGNASWACGGGGGFTSVTKKTAKSSELMLLAAGGGGGGSLDGLPGCAFDGLLPGTVVDAINGKCATVDGPGGGGDCGSTYISQWPSETGDQYKGGDGCEFGGGGGSGFYGGGGGGTNPGIGGGGGGGSSFVSHQHLLAGGDHVVIPGWGVQAGGRKHDPPPATGVGEWDLVGGLAGDGGQVTEDQINAGEFTAPGKNGAIRILKPGFY